MLRLAVTGPSGSGKGYICALLERRGIPCLDTDRVVHELYDSPSFVAGISSELGCDIEGKDGKIDRNKLAGMVFHSTSAMKTLLKTVYPAVWQKCEYFFQHCEEEGRIAAVLDAPQLFESGFEKKCDAVIAVDAPEELRLRRILLRDGISKEAAILRMAHQKSSDEYRVLSDYVLFNGNGVTTKNLEEQIDALLSDIFQKAGIEIPLKTQKAP